MEEHAVSAAENLAGNGILGSLLLLALLALVWMSRRLNEVQDARVEDAKKVSKDALDREQKWQDILNDLNNAIERLTERLSK